MIWFKKNPLFFSFLIVLFLVFLGQLYFLFQKKGEADAARQQYESQAAAYNSLLNKRPSPMRENVGLVEADLERVKERLVGMRDSLSARADVQDMLANAPVDTTQAYFDIQSFVNNARELAADYGIEVAEGEMFGFSLYRTQGPEPDLIEDVYKQRRVIEYLVERLFEAGPTQLLIVSREDPASDPDEEVDDPYGSSFGGFGVYGPTSGGGGNRPAPGGGAADRDRTRGDELFAMDRQISARIPNILETHAFRLSFEGDTGVLRQFLNDLSMFEMPIVVRSVEVESASGSMRGGGSYSGTSIGGRQSSTRGSFGTTSGFQPRAVSQTTGSQNPYGNPYGQQQFGWQEDQETIPLEPVVEETHSHFTVTVEFIELLPSRVLQNSSY